MVPWREGGSQPYVKLSGVIKSTHSPKGIDMMAADRWKNRRDQIIQASYYSHLEMDLVLDKGWFSLKV